MSRCQWRGVRRHRYVSWWLFVALIPTTRERCTAQAVVVQHASTVGLLGPIAGNTFKACLQHSIEEGTHPCPGKPPIRIQTVRLDLRGV